MMKIVRHGKKGPLGVMVKGPNASRLQMFLAYDSDPIQ